jgi:hypothetical protein
MSFLSSSQTFTPAAAAYSALDVMDVAKAFSGMNYRAGGTVVLRSTELLISTTALQASEANYYLNLYNVTPPSAYADNAAWDLPSGDRASWLGRIDLGTPVDLGSSLYIRQTGLTQPMLIPHGGIVYAYLVTVAGFTATAVARKVTLHVEV